MGSSATIGTATQFEGNILALTSITFDPGATLSTGRALAIDGAVTLSGGNSINLNAPGAPLVPEGAFWNGSQSNLWSDMNWSSDTTGIDTGLLPAGAYVVFSTTDLTALNQDTQLDFNALISSLTVNNGAGLVTINSALVLGGASQGITVDNEDGLRINGSVAGILGLTKEGAGLLTLNGSNTYTGGTIINNGALAVGNAAALSQGPVTNNAVLQTTATGGGAVQTINVNGDYSQGAGGLLLLQVVTTPPPTPSASTGVAGINYDTLVADGAATLNGGLNLNFAGTSIPFRGQQYVALRAGDPLVTQFSSSTTTNLDPSFFTVTTYNNTFGGIVPANSVVVTLMQSFASIRPLTPNQTNVAKYVDNAVTFLNNNGSLAQATGNTADFFNNIVMGLNNSSTSAGSLGLALNELSPQRFEIFHNIAFDNYAFDVQNLDEQLARERRGNGGFDASGFTYNDSRLGTQLSQIKSRLLAWSPSPGQSNLMSDSGSPFIAGWI